MTAWSDTVNVTRIARTLAMLLLIATAGVVVAESDAHELSGLASWYGGKFQGRLTANGEVFDTNLLTAAHRTLPFGTLVRVTHQMNGRSVIVRINDRGPFVEGRIIDLSRAAAEALEMTGEGVAAVVIEIVAAPAESMWTIQVASFGVRQNATSLVDRLVLAGIGAGIENRENEVSRVVVRGVLESELADELAKLREIGYPDVLVRSQSPD